MGGTRADRCLVSRGQSVGVAGDSARSELGTAAPIRYVAGFIGVTQF